MQDSLQQFAELGLGSRLKRLSEYLMKETQSVYDSLDIHFDAYLFPIFKIIIDQNPITTSEIQEQLRYTQPAVTQALKKLMLLELVDYTVDKVDKRKKKFELTVKGETMYQTLIPVWQAIESQVRWLTEGTSSGLTRHLTHFEDQLREQSLSTRVLKHLKR